MKNANRVQGYLQAVGYTTKVSYYDGLSEICNDANTWKADLFVSIHCNAATGNARGTETFHSGSADGKKLAEFIQKQMISRIDIVDRGVKQAGFYVIKYTNMPAVLVETAFIDNPADAKLLVEHEDDFARAIAVGITDYFAGSQSVSKTMPDTVDLPKSKSATHSVKILINMSLPVIISESALTFTLD